MPPPAVSPDQILDYAPRGSRIVRVDSNVVAYFGDLFQAFRTAVASRPKGVPAPSNGVPASSSGKPSPQTQGRH
jgi:hypothetical protein